MVKSLSAATLGLALVLAACTNDTGDAGSGGGRAAASATAKGDNGDGTYNAPEVSAGPGIIIAHSSPYTAYNNKTAATNSNGNTLVLNQVLADPFILDGNGQYLLNADVMESAAMRSEDPQVVTYRIKPDITWSDGQAWDCDDFYLAWLAGSGKAILRDPAGQPILDAQGREQEYFRPATTSGYERATGECVDSLTFVETYEAPYADWRSNYIQNTILPAHILERETGIADITQITPDSAAAELQRVADFWNAGWQGFAPDTMPSSGPYHIENWQPGAAVALSHNESWAGNAGGPERIVLASIADGAVQVRGLGEETLTVVTPPADPALAGMLRGLATRGVIFEVRGGPAREHLDMNLAHPLFGDLAVRRAFALCIDRNDLVERLVRGVDRHAQPLGSLVRLPGAPGYEDVYSDKMTADAEAAKETLERAGWVLAPDGVYTKAGQRLSFGIVHDGGPRQQQIVQLVRQHCRIAGMEIVDGGGLGSLPETLERGAFDVVLLATERAAQGSSLAARYQTSGEQNFQSYSDPEVDDALEAVKVEDDEAARAAALDTVDRLIAEAYASLPLFAVPDMWAYSDIVDGVFRHPSHDVTWNANEWEIG